MKVKSNPWFGTIDNLGGYGRLVVAESQEKAEKALLDEWKKYDREYVSDYRGQVKTFKDLADIYGAYVRCMPWNVAVLEGM